MYGNAKCKPCLFLVDHHAPADCYIRALKRVNLRNVVLRVGRFPTRKIYSEANNSRVIFSKPSQFQGKILITRLIPRRSS
jgi:hypothetical protein